MHEIVCFDHLVECFKLLTCLRDLRVSTGAKEIDIAATLEHLRDQRMHMVRTKIQFEFVLKAVAEEVHAILRSLQGSSA